MTRGGLLCESGIRSKVQGFKGFILLAVYLFIPLIVAASAFGQEAFYKEQTIRIIVGFAPGGGYDLYSRTIARHLGKYVAGNPNVLVENMDGAGSRIAANYVYNTAKPDGLIVGHFIGGLFVQQLLGDPGIKFDAQKFEYIGVPAQDNMMIGISKRVGIKSVKEWMASKEVIKLGGVAPGSAKDDHPKILKELIGLSLQLVSGYKGTGPVRLALHSGEIDGVANAWESFKSTWRKEVETREVIIILQNVAKRHPELPNIPLAIDFAKTDEARKIIRAVVHTYGPTARPYVLPPGTPKDRVRILRKAFMDTMRDPEFLAEAKKAKLDINPLDGDELEKNVYAVDLEPGLAAKLKEILK